MNTNNLLIDYQLMYKINQLYKEPNNKYALNNIAITFLIVKICGSHITQ